MNPTKFNDYEYTLTHVFYPIILSKRLFFYNSLLCAGHLYCIFTVESITLILLTQGFVKEITIFCILVLVLLGDTIRFQVHPYGPTS